MIKIYLETERLIIKPLTLDDARSLLSYRSKEEVMRFQTFKPKNLTNAINFIGSTSSELNVPETWYQLGLFKKESSEHIGDIGIHFLNNKDETEIGCTIAPEYWNKGYAKESLEIVVSFIFNTLKKKKVFANIGLDNLRSRRLFESLGFRLVSQTDSEASYQLV